MNREEHLQETFPTKGGKTYIQSLDEFNTIKTLLEEIRDAIKEQQLNQQPTTKITVVGNGQGQKTTKGLKSDEDFEF
jgi:NADH dehydrogenase FAD-containing subunit